MSFTIHLKTEFEQLDLREVLDSSPEVLLGVSPDATVLLGGLGIKSVYDLALGGVFLDAARVIHAAEDPSSVIAQHGSLPADVLDNGLLGGPIADLPDTSTDGLMNIGPVGAQAFDDVLGVRSIRDLALWPPFLAAQKLVAEAYSPERRPGYDSEAPRELIPRSGEQATHRVHFTSTVLLESHAPSIAWNGAPIDVTSLSQVGFEDVAFGALVHVTQSWSPRAVALGQLLHSLPLAPGESTRLSVVDWTRRVRASTDEEVSQSESMSSAMHQSTAINEVTSAVAKEFQTGDSFTGNTSASGSASAPGLLGLIGLEGGVGGTGGVAGTYSTTSGRRSVASTAQQNIASRTQQNAALSRSRRAAIVSEVSESETENISTRIVINNNHMHALSLQYYEVIQTYETALAVTGIERCLFLPMKLINFRNERIVRRYLPILAATALDRQTRGLLQRLGRIARLEFAIDRFATDAMARLRSDALALASTPFDLSHMNEWIEALQQRAAVSHLSDAIAALSRSVRLDAETAARRGIISGFDGTAVRWLTMDRQALVKDASWDPTSGIRSVILRDTDSEEQRITVPGDTSTPKTTVAPELGVAMPISRLASISVQMEAASGASASDLVIVPLRLLVELRGRTVWLDLDFVTSAATNGELRLMRVQAPVDVEEVSDRLMGEQLYYSQQIWRRANRQSLIMQLANVSVRMPDGTAIRVIDFLDPTPITVAGNYLAFRLTYEVDESWQRWKKLQFADARPHVELVPLPTGGVFAEAVLSESNSAEKLDATRFWKWEESRIPNVAPEIAPTEAGSHQRIGAPTPGQLGDAILKLQAAPALPALGNSDALFKAAIAAKMFRDMSGPEITRQLLGASLKAAQEGDDAAVKQANETLAKINAALASVAKGILDGGPKLIETAKGLGSALNLAGSVTGSASGGGAGGAGALLQGGAQALGSAGGAEGIAAIASEIGPIVESIGMLALL